MQANGSPTPKFETNNDRTSFLIRLPAHPQVERMREVTGEVNRLVAALAGEMKRTELQKALGFKHEDHFREAYLIPSLQSGLVELTIPDKPRSRLQEYRLTSKGQAWLSTHKHKGPRS